MTARIAKAVWLGLPEEPVAVACGTIWQKFNLSNPGRMYTEVDHDEHK